MARLPRLNLPGITQHVVQRGNNRQVSFIAEQDYTVYLDKLKDYARQYRVAVHAYVLMTNHVHLLMTPDTATGIKGVTHKSAGVNSARQIGSPQANINCCVLCLSAPVFTRSSVFLSVVLDIISATVTHLDLGFGHTSPIPHVLSYATKTSVPHVIQCDNAHRVSG